MGEVLELIPLHPSRVKPKLGADGVLFYEVKLSNGQSARLEAEAVFHLRGYRDEGLEGLSPIAAAHRAIRMGNSLESFATNFIEGGAFPAGVLEYENGAMTQEAKENLRSSWQKMFGGESRGKKVAVLEAGLKWKPMGIPQADAQFLEQRRFQIEEIARIYRVPPHMLADLTRSTNNNIETQSQEFVTYCLLPWFRMWEDAICRDFFDGDDSRYFAAFVLDGLLRGDTAARTASYTAGINGGWLSKNDVRLKEDMNTIGPEGDIYLSPMNMVPAGSEEDANDANEPASEEPKKEDPPKKEDTPAPDKVRSALRSAVRETWCRVVRKEIKQVQAAARRKMSPDEFTAWVTEFSEEHRDFAKDCMKDLYSGYAVLVGGDAGALERHLDTYMNEIRDSASKWVNNPEVGYLRDEGKVADYWASVVLGYSEGEYVTAA